MCPASAMNWPFARWNRNWGLTSSRMSLNSWRVNQLRRRVLDKVRTKYELYSPELVLHTSILRVASKCTKLFCAKMGNWWPSKSSDRRARKSLRWTFYVLRWWSGVYNVIFTLLNRNIDLQSIIDDFGESSTAKSITWPNPATRSVSTNNTPA
jgi:hypothetical protein